jgi:ferritin-like metal-binding protein YciE
MEMPETDVREKLTSYISDAIALEQNVEQMLSGMISTTEDPTMRERLEQHQEETRAQQERLRGRLESYGESGSAVKGMAAKAGAAMKGVLDMGRGDKAGKNARDGYATEHLEIAAYQLLERVAVIAGDESTAEVARQNRAEEEAMARFIEERWDDVARQSLREEGVLS